MPALPPPLCLGLASWPVCCVCAFPSVSLFFVCCFVACRAAVLAVLPDQGLAFFCCGLSPMLPALYAVFNSQRLFALFFASSVPILPRASPLSTLQKNTQKASPLYAARPPFEIAATPTHPSVYPPLCLFNPHWGFFQVCPPVRWCIRALQNVHPTFTPTTLLSALYPSGFFNGTPTKKS